MNSNNPNTKLDDSNFPIVRITFGNTIKDNEEFEEIKNFWIKQYLHKKYFYIIFDTSNMNTLPISYLYKLGKFAGKLKKLEIQYLKASIILIKSDFVRGLYSFYLNIQKPISKVYIIKEDKDINIILNKLQNNEKISGYVEYNP
tara:strand:- start:218 stop:649 length:432 start_codon:yes stop_codon:yes gene_type:complete